MTTAPVEDINVNDATQILVVDDDELTREILAHALRRCGYEVLEASDGREALAILESTACQLVVTDWEMPHLNGLELCRHIRSDRLGRYVYVILLTNRDSAADVVDGLDAGADDFLAKPFNPVEVVARVRAGRRVLALESAEMAIFAMARLAESRDPETGAHLERVRSYCRVLAERLRYDSDYAERMNEDYAALIYQTSPLHDIGKVAIPDCVLLKAGRLSDDEFEVMKSHTVRGAATLHAAMRKYPNARFLRMAHDIALTHHERWDGRGYPNRLAGENIPLCGRVMAVADVYDALTSKRVYKDAFDHKVARNIIVDDRGTHFDPEIVDAFVAVEDEFVEIRRQVTDRAPFAAAA